jgi:hypothetical protein
LLSIFPMASGPRKGPKKPSLLLTAVVKSFRNASNLMAFC